MAGVKGRSGGLRAGAGRKPKPVVPIGIDDLGADVDSLGFLRAAMNDKTLAHALRVRAAIEIAKYEHTKTHDGGKKDSVKESAKVAAAGKFAPSSPPKLVVNNK